MKSAKSTRSKEISNSKLIIIPTPLNENEQDMELRVKKLESIVTMCKIKIY
jgi:hypothetical protein